MRQNIVSMLALLGIDEPLYWGKKVVRALPQPGAFKSHCVVANWMQPGLIRVDLRAGLSGKKLTDKDLAQYPLQLQSETFFEFDVEDEDGDAKGKSGKSSQSGGGAGLRKKASTELSGFFQSAQHEKVPTHARLARGVVMGMQIGQGALDKVFGLFCDQVRAAKVLATDLLVSAGKAVTRYTPPAFMSPRGDENKVYKYDRTKNEPMFGMAPT